MSALVASLNRPGAEPGHYDRLVTAALVRLGSRARGAAHQLRVTPEAALGVRDTWPDDAAPTTTDRPSPRLASRRTGGTTVALAVSGSLDNLAGLPWVAPGVPVATVLLEAYLAEGATFVERLGGSFAIVVHDGRTGRTLAARDRLGIEPLYYWRSPGQESVLLASEPKGILVDPGFPRTFDLASLLDLLNSTSRVPGTTVYRELREVRPGEVLTFTGRSVRATRYWSLPVVDPEPGTRLDEAAAAVAHEAGAAVRRRLAGDQGFLLSGGLDSSVICVAAWAGQAGAAPMRTYSFVYQDAERDFRPDQLHVSLDSPFVDVMRRHLGSEHTEVTVPDAEYLQTLERTVRARDLPGVGDLDMALLRLFDAVAPLSREVFSGEGADDLFGGYPWFAAEWQAPGRGFPWLRDTQSFRFLAPEVRESVELPQALEHRWYAAESELSALPRRDPRQDHLDRVYYMELTRFLPFLLDRVDRMSAAAGLRVQLPFTDHRLVEAVWRLPHDLKSAGGMEKGLLRTAFAGQLPAEVAWRRKSGFAVGRSPHYLQAMFDYVQESFLTGSSPVAPLLDVEHLRRVVSDRSWADGAFSGPPVVPRLVMLDLWARLYGVQCHDLRVPETL